MNQFTKESLQEHDIWRWWTISYRKFTKKNMKTHQIENLDKKSKNRNARL